MTEIEKNLVIETRDMILIVDEILNMLAEMNDMPHDISSGLDIKEKINRLKNNTKHLLGR